MNRRPPEDLSGVPMLDLFRAEADIQTAALTAGLLEIERGTTSAQCLEQLMRAAHSLKGAARIVSLPRIEHLAHGLEDCFEAVFHGPNHFRQGEVDLLLRAVDTLATLVKRADSAAEPAEAAEAATSDRLAQLMVELRRLAAGIASPNREAAPGGQVSELPPENALTAAVVEPPAPLLSPLPVRTREAEERVLRLAAETLNRLLGLAGESLIESRWLRPFSDSLHQLKRHHMNVAEQLDKLRQAVEDGGNPDETRTRLDRMVQELAGAQQFLADRVQELDTFERRTAHLSQRLYLEVLRTRMRPFSDGVRRFPRMVRDLARALNKQVRLEIFGESTQVDRDILERLETPLGHLLRNAVDHGCEPPDVRVRCGKAPESIIRLEARHSAGILLVTVSDDGTGVRLEDLRRALVRKRISTPAQAERFSEAELLEFLCVPGFTLKEAVTEISGRGYGLDVVQNMVRNVRGSIRLQNHPGRGLRVQLQLPLTLSVVRVLLVQVAGEPYAIPLGQISRTLKVSRSTVHLLEGRQYLALADQQVGLISAHEVLAAEEPFGTGDELSVVVIGDRANRYGLMVDRFLGERELVVQPLQANLGRIKCVSSAALMEDGAPVLILDVEDLMHSIQAIISGLNRILDRPARPTARKEPKRVLIVDDSPTLRQLEQRLLVARGYSVNTAADGLDAWSAVCASRYDLVITDIEMPRMDGFDLARSIKQRPDLRNVAVLIISYKDKEEDRIRGQEVGADYYLAKGALDEDALLKTVLDLIGEPDV